MRIVHMSDTHLGYQAYRTLDKETGLNRRELDVYDSFQEAVDLAIGLKPDAVLHTGDLFDSVRPTNLALTVAFETLRRFGEAGIPLVMISGNHSMPRVRGTASVFRLFDIPEFGQIFPVYKRAYEKITLGDLAIHAVPQCLSNEDLHEELKKAGPDPDARFNILMLHAAVAGVPEFSMGEFSEQVVPEDFLRPDYDYIALGHYHRFTNVRKNAYYAGATERFGFGEVEQDKGIVEVDLAAKTVKFHKVGLRPMRDLSAIDATGMEPEQIQAAIETAVKNTGGSIARLTVQNISPAAQSALDFNKLKELAKQATHLEIRYVKDESETEQEIAPAAIGSLSDELRGFIKSRPADKKNEDILNLGLEYLDRAARERS